jgi:enoyl-CoA hydratase/carnithine racemase
LLAAEEFDAQTMLATGFLNHLVLPGRLDEESSQLARRIAGLAPLAVRSMKEMMQQSISGNIDPGQAQRLLDLCSNSEDLQEGLSAQREKRVARFKGR